MESIGKAEGRHRTSIGKASRSIGKPSENLKNRHKKIERKT
jgi:hypothetical protein